MRKEKETRRRRRVGVGIGIINGTMIRSGDCCLFSPASLFSFPPSTTSTSTSTSTSFLLSLFHPNLAYRIPPVNPLPLSPRPHTSHRLPLSAPACHAQSVPAIPPSSTHLRGGTLVSAVSETDGVRRGQRPTPNTASRDHRRKEEEKVTTTEEKTTEKTKQEEEET